MLQCRNVVTQRPLGVLWCERVGGLAKKLGRLKGKDRWLDGQIDGERKQYEIIKEREID